ncbi:spore germination protein [Desulfovirgula thermocuniculi]|uniref:spore germination protein n=1 Tax=Desulfovirgula thermocuniculi TaxID=348842 RepID=UPI0005578A57|nr:spore germination protein [Desulfovirgula thermocuniculi]
MRRVLRQLARLLPKKKKSLQAVESGVQWEKSYEAAELKQRPVSARLVENVSFLNEVLGHNSDFVLREIRLGVGAGVPAALAYVDGLVDRAIVSDTLIKGLTLEGRMAGLKAGDAGDLLLLAKNFLVSVAAVKEAADYFALLNGLLYGEVALLIDGEDRALLVDAKGWAVRNIEEPASEGLVRGPREGFTELMRTNTALIRRRLRDPNLVVEGLCFGERTRTQVEIVYIRGLAAPELVQEVKDRLSRIHIDGILESGQIEELIEDNPYTPFPQVFHTERPDRVVSMLLEGRVAIITDGTPIVLVVPAEFAVFMQAGEDYYERYFLATAIRWLRYIALVTSLTLPSLYIAMTTYHQEMIPPRLLTSVASSREGIPFPAFVEALLMEFFFEALREAGIRLPRQVGQAVSIVGALVIGQAAVSANIVSPLMVIVVALTGIASFAAPVFSLAITMRLLRFPMMVCAATLGLYGIVAGLLAILVHAAGLRSFGIPYLAPLAPLHRRDLKDMLVRAPTWAMDHRPTELVKGDKRRQAPGQVPRPGSRRPPGGGGGGA